MSEGGDFDRRRPGGDRPVDDRDRPEAPRRPPVRGSDPRAAGPRSGDPRSGEVRPGEARAGNPAVPGSRTGNPRQRDVPAADPRASDPRARQGETGRVSETSRTVGGPREREHPGDSGAGTRSATAPRRSRATPSEPKPVPVATRAPARSASPTASASPAASVPPRTPAPPPTPAPPASSAPPARPRRLGAGARVEDEPPAAREDPPAPARAEPADGRRPPRGTMRTRRAVLPDRDEAEGLTPSAESEFGERRMPAVERPPEVAAPRRPAPARAARTAVEDEESAYIPTDRGAPRKRKREAPTQRPRREAPTRKPVDVASEDDERPVEEGPIVSPRSIAGRGLTVVVAIMTFLCGLLVGGAILIDHAATAWSANVLDEITVTVLPLDGDPLDARLDRVAEILSQSGGLGAVTIVPAAESEALLQPWLGDGIDLSPLPIPRLVTAERRGGIDTGGLTNALTEVPGTSLDDHTAWSDRLANMASAAAGGAIAALALMLIATGISIVFATRSAIATNAATVEVLNALGAEDRFIMRAFGRRFVGIGARGAALGMAVALALFGVLDLWSLISSGAQSMQSRALFGDPSIGLWGYAALVAVAVGVVVLVAVTSAMAVRRHLERMYH